MSKVLIVDIESTGFSSRKDKIIEIAIVELDLTNGNVEIVFDELINEYGLTQNEFTESWIFKNSNIKMSDIAQAKNLQYHWLKIQEIISANPIGITAFNNSFDFRFLAERQFYILRKLKDPMRLSKNICRIPDKRGNNKNPTVEEAYNYFYPGENYIETHRAAHDAIQEAKIVYKLYKMGVF